MNKRIQKLFPKEFYAKDDLSLYAEISLRDLNIIIDYIEKLEQENKQIKEKIDKALEYIKKEYKFLDINTGEKSYTKGGKDLLEILGDKENE